MLQLILKPIKSAFILLLVFALFTGIIYPAIVTLIAQVLFPSAANGSLIKRDQAIMGSSLIGQAFSDAHYFQGRPSATPDFPYNALSSSGSNLAFSNPDYQITLKNRIHALQTMNPNQLIPIELVTSSGSGLDPDISLAGAYYQVPRIAKVRHIDPNLINELIKKLVHERTFYLLGEKRINVLQLNLALDQLTLHKESIS